ncbi:chemotaxis protein CheB [Crossiella sp. CA198]|uniref:chemotaxis protein CheB n=1 Tax=Crossiella sp. CA198 TaxID=3455607 RepID=UPI003F8D6687
MTRRDVVAIGASAGGVEALCAVVGALPPGLPAVVLVVLHVPRNAPSALPRILSRCGPLPAHHAVHGDPVRRGHIYVAPANHHLLLTDGRIQLSRGPAENGHRPAVDPLFRSVARAHGSRSVGVVLSGARDDGTAGLAAIKAVGGLIVVQDPAEAPHRSMPVSAQEHNDVQHVLSAAEIGGLIGKVAAAEVPDTGGVVDDLLAAEAEMAEFSPMTTDELGAVPAGLACPSCHGALFDLPGEPVPRFRCRVGHAWSPETLLAEQGFRMAESATERGNTWAARRFADTATDTKAAGRLVRDLINRIATGPPDRGEGEPDEQ